MQVLESEARRRFYSQRFISARISMAKVQELWREKPGIARPAFSPNELIEMESREEQASATQGAYLGGRLLMRMIVVYTSTLWLRVQSSRSVHVDINFAKYASANGSCSQLHVRFVARVGFKNRRDTQLQGRVLYMEIYSFGNENVESNFGRDGKEFLDT